MSTFSRGELRPGDRRHGDRVAGDAPGRPGSATSAARSGNPAFVGQCATLSVGIARTPRVTRRIPVDRDRPGPDRQPRGLRRRSGARGPGPGLLGERAGRGRRSASIRSARAGIEFRGLVRTSSRVGSAGRRLGLRRLRRGDHAGRSRCGTSTGTTARTSSATGPTAEPGVARLRRRRGRDGRRRRRAVPRERRSWRRVARLTSRAGRSATRTTPAAAWTTRLTASVTACVRRTPTCGSSTSSSATGSAARGRATATASPTRTRRSSSTSWSATALRLPLENVKLTLQSPAPTSGTSATTRSVVPRLEKNGGGLPGDIRHLRHPLRHQPEQRGERDPLPGERPLRLHGSRGRRN